MLYIPMTSYIFAFYRDIQMASVSLIECDYLGFLDQQDSDTVLVRNVSFVNVTSEAAGVRCLL